MQQILESVAYKEWLTVITYNNNSKNIVNEFVAYVTQLTQNKA